jgi:AmiR/NasT family two-component response regulator
MTAGAVVTQCRLLAVSAYLLKPMQSAELIAAIGSAVGPSRSVA